MQATFLDRLRASEPTDTPEARRRQANAAARLLERLHKGQAWLTGTDAYLCTQEHTWDAARQRFAGYLDAWVSMETQLRTLFSYDGCIYGPSQHCPPDAVVRCMSCAGDLEASE